MHKFITKYKKYLLITTSLVVIIGLYFVFNILTGKADDSGDRIHFVSSKEGDGIIIESNGHCGLIDALDPAEYDSVTNSNTCALETTDTSSLGNGNTLKNYAQSIGCTHFDFVIMTNSYKEHIGGIPLLEDLFDENTIVFYKEDITSSDDYEENSNCGTNENHANQARALATFNKKGSITCDVSKAIDLDDPKCNLSQLTNSFISKVSYSDNDSFLSDPEGYNTNIRNTVYFNFGDFKINLFNLYNLSSHQEKYNSIATLVYHKNGAARAAFTGDIAIGPIDENNDEINSLSSIIENPTGSCYECTTYGIENQVADVIRHVDLLKAANHGLQNSNSLYALNRFYPRFYITTGGDVNSNLYESNIAAITYLKNAYGTKSYISSQAEGAIVAQFNDLNVNNLTIMNYDATGTEVNGTLTDISTIVYKDLNENYLDGKKTIRNDSVDNNGYVYIKDGRPVVNNWIPVEENNVTKTYHAKADGLLDLGFSEPINDNVFYFSNFGNEHDGEMLTGLSVVKYNDNNYLYYFRTEPDVQNAKPIGTYVTGLTTIGDKTYYFREEADDVNGHPEGSAVSGIVEIGGYKYYFVEDNDELSSYYMAKNTYVQDDSTGEVITYYADSDGHLTNSNESIAIIPTSTVCENAIYSGEELTLALDGDGYTVSNNTATNVGTYNVTAHLESGYKWNDNSTSDKTFSCTIEKADPEINETNSQENVYKGFNGDLVTLTANTAGRYVFSSDGTYITVSTPFIEAEAAESITLSINAIKSGISYVDISFIPTDATNYNGASYRKTVIVGDNGTTAVIPTARNYCKNNLVYNGHEQVLTNDPGVGYTFINNTGTNAAYYNVTARLTEGFTWTDGTTTDKIIECTIDAYTPVITKSEINTNITVDATDTLVTISSDVPGTFTYTSNEYVSLETSQDIVQAGSSRNIVVTGLKAGDAHVRINFTPSEPNTYTTWMDIYFEVKNTTVPYPTSEYFCNKNLVYNGSAQTLADSHSEYVTLINNSATNAGTHTVTARINTVGIEWPDGTTADKTFDCTISKANPVITKTNLLTTVPESYSGRLVTVSTTVVGRYIFSSDAEHIEVTTPLVNATANQNVDFNINAIKSGSSDVQITFVPTDTTNYNEVSDEETITVTGSVATAEIPTAEAYCKNNLVYNGQEQILTNAHGQGYTFSDNEATNAGNHTVTASLDNGFEWTDGTTSDKTIVCNIAKYTPNIVLSNEKTEITAGFETKIMTVSSDVPGILTYQEDEYVDVNNSIDPIYASHDIDVEVIGLKKGVATITVTFTPENSENIESYEFTKNITVNRTVIPLPTVDNFCVPNLVYNRSEQTLADPHTNIFELINNSATTAGDHVVTVRILDTNQMEWADGTTTNKTVTCSIAKANPVLVINSINTDNISQFSTTDIMSFIPDLAGVFTFNAGNTIITNYNSEIAVNKNEAAVFAGTGSNVGTTSLVVTFVPTNTNYNSFTHSYNITVVGNSEHIVDIPTSTSSCKLDLVYNGSEKVLTVDDTEAYEFINNVGSSAGDYNVTVRLKGDYKWSDNTTADKTVTCNIKKAPLGVPSIEGYIGTYDGNPHTINAPIVIGGSPRYSLDNINWSETAPTRTDAGTTLVYVKYLGDNNYLDSSVYSTNIVINKANPVISTANLSPHIEKGGDVEAGPISVNIAGSIQLESSDENILRVPTLPIPVVADEQYKFTITGVNGGETSYTITFTPASSNYNPKTITTNIAVNTPLMPPVVIPTADTYCKSNLKYTGSPITITNDPATGYTFSNNVQTNVGTYTVTAKLQSGYYWEDNTTADKTFNCSILQADSYLNFNNKLVSSNGYIKAKVTPPITYTKFKSYIDTNGVISHSKADTDNVATCDTLSINLGGVVQNFTLVIPGDITKNGTAGSADVTLLFNYLRNKASLNTCQLKASDTTNDDQIHINDVAKLYQFVNNKIEGLGE